MNCSEIEFGGMTIDEEDADDDEADCEAADSQSDPVGVAVDEPDEATEHASEFSSSASELADSDAGESTVDFDVVAAGSFT
jgi:hypothetical protein